MSVHAPPPTAIYTLSLHDALPIYERSERMGRWKITLAAFPGFTRVFPGFTELALVMPATHATMNKLALLFHSEDRKSTRLNSSHLVISYAVFCLKKKKKKQGRLVS